MRFTRKEYIFIFIISILCILFFMGDVVHDYFSGGFHGFVAIKYISTSDFDIPNAIYYTWIFHWILLIGLFFITLIGIYKGYKKQLGNKFYTTSLVLIIIYLIWDYPIVDKHISFTCRTISDILGLGLMISFLITIIFERYNHNASQKINIDIQDKKKNTSLEKELPKITEKYPFFVLIIITLFSIYPMSLLMFYSYSNIHHYFFYCKIINCICFIIMIQYTFRKKRFCHTLFFIILLIILLPFLTYGNIMLSSWLIVMIIIFFILIYLCFYYYPKSKK